MAIILLDASCEHVISLARAEVGLGDFKELGSGLDQLVNSAGDWRPGAARKMVAELRKQRNGAMHHGTVPDFDQVARWSQDAETFVRSVVKRFFWVDLGEVAVSDIVRDDEVRLQLAGAELAFEARDFAEAKFMAVDALDKARERWRRSRSFPDPGVRWFDRRMANIPEGIRADLERLRDESEVRSFAGDFGEYLWLRDQHRRYARDAPVLPDDARRALAFVTEWILRWDEHVARSIDREAEWRAQMRPPTSGDPEARPSVRGVEVVVDDGAERMGPPMVRVVSQIQDIPEMERERWCFFAGNELSGYLGGYGSRGAECDPDGRLSFSIPLDSELTESLAAKVARGVKDAHEQWERYCEAEERRRADAADVLDECRKRLELWLSETSWLRGVEYVAERDDIVRANFVRVLDGGQRYWLLELLKKHYGEQPGAHRLEVMENWLAVPIPSDGQRVGDIIAAALTAMDEAESQMRATRLDLERYASELQLGIREQFRSLGNSQSPE